jgi:hypothetical protein
VWHFGWIYAPLEDNDDMDNDTMKGAPWYTPQHFFHYCSGAKEKMKWRIGALDNCFCFVLIAIQSHFPLLPRDIAAFSPCKKKTYDS